MIKVSMEYIDFILVQSLLVSSMIFPEIFLTMHFVRGVPDQYRKKLLPPMSMEKGTLSRCSAISPNLNYVTSKASKKVSSGWTQLLFHVASLIHT